MPRFIIVPNSKFHLAREKIEKWTSELNYHEESTQDEELVAIIITSGVARWGAQGARAPPSALGLVDIVYRTALSSTPLATSNRNLLQNNSLEDA